MARAAATRLLAELTGRPALHPLLASSGAAAALAAQGAQLVRFPGSLSGTRGFLPPYACRSGPLPSPTFCCACSPSTTCSIEVLMVAYHALQIETPSTEVSILRAAHALLLACLFPALKCTEPYHTHNRSHGMLSLLLQYASC